MVSTRKTFVLVRRDGAYREAVLERRRCIHEVGGISNAEIRGNSRAHSAICLDGLVLAGRQPEFYPRKILADCDDIPEMIDALQIAGIVPAEVAVPGAIDKGSYRVYPPGMSKTFEALLHCRPDSRKHISAA